MLLLLQLLRKLLFSYCDVALDADRLLQLATLFADALSANADALKSDLQLNTPASAQRLWMLKRLLDLCVQSQSSSSSPVLFAMVLQLADVSYELRQYLLTGRQMATMDQTTPRCKTLLYCAMEKHSLVQIARRIFISARGQHHQLGSSTAIPAAKQAHCNYMMDLLVRFLRTSTAGESSAFLGSFVQEVG